MKIFGNETLEEFAKLHPRAEVPLKRWQSHVLQADWSNFSKLKQTFKTADYFKGLVIFNIGGNKFRLIAQILYDKQCLFVRQILTHQEYDENKWKRQNEST